MGVQDNNLNRKIIDKSIFIPYGLEIETEGILYNEGKRILSHKIDSDWQIKTDNTLDDCGIEITSPVLKNDKETLIKLKKLAKTLSFLGARFEHASLQINLDFFYQTSTDIIYLLKMFSIYQNVIYRFSMGTDDKIRNTAFDYAVPMGGLFRDKYNMTAKKESSYERFINNKSFSMSLKTLSRNRTDPIKVVEFRTPNGTSDFYLWMNYLVFFSSFLNFVINQKYDKEYVDYTFDRVKFANSVEELVSIDEKRATQLAELIYTSEPEKTCFYNQYFDKVIKKK